MLEWERQRREQQDKEKREEEERKRREEEEKRREEENRERIAEEAKLLKTKSDEVMENTVCLFDLIIYVPSTMFQLSRNGSSWVEPVLS